MFARICVGWSWGLWRLCAPLPIDDCAAEARDYRRPCRSGRTCVELTDAASTIVLARDEL